MRSERWVSLAHELAMVRKTDDDSRAERNARRFAVRSTLCLLHTRRSGRNVNSDFQRKVICTIEFPLSELVLAVCFRFIRQWVAVHVTHTKNSKKKTSRQKYLRIERIHCVRPTKMRQAQKSWTDFRLKYVNHTGEWQKVLHLGNAIYLIRLEFVVYVANLFMFVLHFWFGLGQMESRAMLRSYVSLLPLYSRCMSNSGSCRWSSKKPIANETNFVEFFFLWLLIRGILYRVH